MDQKIIQDIERFFSIYKDRTADIQKYLPPEGQAQFSEEIDLLKASILNRVHQSLRQ